MSNNDQRLKNICNRFFGIEEEHFFDDLMKHATLVELDGGSILFHSGEKSDSMFILISGRLQVIVQRHGHRSKVGEVKVGETVGEMALITESKRSATVEALRDSLLLSIQKKEFNQLVEKYPEALWRITRLLTKRLDSAINMEAYHDQATNLVFLDLCADEMEFNDFVHSLFDQMPGNAKEIIDVDKVRNRSDQKTEDFSRSNHSLTNWLTDLERQLDSVFLLARRKSDSWSQRCIRHADRIIVVTDHKGLDENALSRFPFERSNGKLSTTEQELVILHEGDPNETARILEQLKVQRHFHIRKGATKDLQRLCRYLTANEHGLVLSGGGAKGLAHIGILRAMEEASIPIDFIGGTSIGSVIGGLAAMGLSAEEIRLRTRDIFISNPTPLLEYNLLPIFSLVSGNTLQKHLVKNFGGQYIEDLWHPFFCVSSNLTNADMHIHESGELDKAVRASISLPGIFPPSIQDNKVLVDGAIFNNLPVDIMAGKGVGKLIAINLSSATPDQVNFDQLPKGRTYLMNRLFGRKKDELSEMPTLMQVIVQSTLVNSDALANKWRDRIDLLFDPDVSEFGLMDWKSFDRIVEKGYEHGIRVLEKKDTAVF